MGHMHEFYAVFRETLIDMKLEDRLTTFEKHVSHRGTIKSVDEMLVRAGFEIKNVSTDSFTVRFADGSSFLRHYFIRLGFLSGWKSIIAREVVEDTFKALEQRLNDYASMFNRFSIKGGHVPHVIVKLYPGRSERQKIQLAEEIAKNVVKIAACKERSVSVAIEEIEPESWAEDVYKPDILAHPEKLYKKPGYDPFE